MEAVGYGHKAGSPQPPDAHFVLFNSPPAPGGSCKPGPGLPSPSQPIPNRFIRRTNGGDPPGAPRLCPSPSLMIKRVPTRLSFVRNDFFPPGPGHAGPPAPGRRQRAGRDLLPYQNSLRTPRRAPRPGHRRLRVPSGGAGSPGARTGAGWGPGLGGDGPTRVGSAPKAFPEPGTHARHGQGREGVKEEEGAPPGPGPVPVIPGPLADSAVAAEKCPTAGAGGSAPGSPLPCCPCPAATRGRGRVAAAPSGPGTRPLGAQHRFLPAPSPRPPKRLPTCCCRPW